MESITAFGMCGPMLSSGFADQVPPRPVLREDNEYIYKTLLGFTDEE